MALKKGDRGQQVKRLQASLLELGESLPRWGVDGGLGVETLAAVASFLVKHGRANVDDPDPTEVDDKELAVIYSMCDLLRRQSRDIVLDKLIDRRRAAGLNWDMGPRPWTEVKGWCLHQAACNLHASKDVARNDRIGAHWVVYPDGSKYWLHEANRKVVHANGWNNQTIGIEISGLFAGVEGDLSTVWDNPDTPYRETASSPTHAQIDAVKMIIRHDYALIRAHGGTPTVIVSHRQSSDQRRADPGSRAWKEVALTMMKELGLTDGGAGFAIGSGLPNPEEWDPSRKGYRY